MQLNRVRTEHILKILFQFRNPRYWWLLIGAHRTRRDEYCPPEIWRVVDPIYGFLTSREAALIYWAAQELPTARPVIELGTASTHGTSQLD